MDIVTYFRAQAHNNAWSNHRLLDCCRKLEPAEIAKTRAGFFPSIIHTLNHILTVDWFYISALEGDCIGAAAFEPEIPYPQIDDLDREQRTCDRRLIKACETLGSKLSNLVQIKRQAGIYPEPIDRVLLHLFQHQIHHRGQVHAMLSDTNVIPPQLDEFFPAGDSGLRKMDFQALGFNEDQIWS